jgi:hypothetical protein
MIRKAALQAVAVFLLALITAFAVPEAADQTGLTVHEWGTFTSVAGVDGMAIPWRTYAGSDDLPCFVDRFGGFKGGLSGTVRMETPVLYFYGSHDASASVKVRFPKGTITEWYPKAMVSSGNESIEWRNVRIFPNAPATFPIEPGSSHYYAARETDAAPLRAGEQWEKFLFYRGSGTFPLPVSAKVTGEGKILVKNLSGEPLRGVVLFSNMAGKPAYQVVGTVEREVTLDYESLQGDPTALGSDLEKILVREGLYRDEALAMIATWRDSWFEEGTRLFYIVAKSSVDEFLPLQIQPAPTRIARVFVGRMEIITPSMQEEVKQAIANNDRHTLEKYGRFLEPIARRLGIKSPLLDAIYAFSWTGPAKCNR